MEIREILDPHIITAICCLFAAIGITGGLIIWLAVECEFMGPPK